MRSQNGWPVLTTGETRQWIVPEANRVLRAHPGPAGFVLAHLALWFHETIEPIDGGTVDDWGYAYRVIRGSTTTWSNHASGTAIDLNAQSHPLGVRNTFNGGQAHRIRARLAGRYEDAIRWGGDYSTRPDEMHFEINRDAAGVLALSHRLGNSSRGRRVRRANPGFSG